MQELKLTFDFREFRIGEDNIHNNGDNNHSIGDCIHDSCPYVGEDDIVICDACNIEFNPSIQDVYTCKKCKKDICINCYEQD